MATPSPPSPAPGPRRRGPTRTVLIVVGAVLAVCCGGGATAAVLAVRAQRADTGPARSAAEAFLRDLEAGNHTGAYGRLCSSTRDRYPPTAFAAGVRAQPAVASHAIRGVAVKTVNGRRTALVTAELTYATGLVDRHTVPLVEEGGGWKVCGQPY